MAVYEDEIYVEADSSSEYSIQLVGTVNDMGGVCDDCSFPQNVIVEVIV